MQSALDKEEIKNEGKKKDGNEDAITMDVDDKETEEKMEEGLGDSGQDKEKEDLAGGRINKDEAASFISNMDKDAGNALAVLSRVLENLQLCYSNLQVDQ